MTTMGEEVATTSKREVVGVHIGQAGVQLGELCWQLFCLEHNLDPDGVHRLLTQPTSSDYEDDDACFGSFFLERQSGSYRARAVYADTGPYAVGAVRGSKYSRLYDTSQLVCGTEDASNNYASGYYSTGRLLLPDTMEQVRRQVEEADSLQGFLVFHSYGGGTGSGFTSLLTERLAIEYPKMADIRFSVMPSSKVASAVVEPYNAVLAAHNSLQLSSATFSLDNSALYDLSHGSLGVDRPTFRHINAIVSQVVSSVTGSLRFHGALNMDLAEICTNLVPFPRLHFLHTSYAPLVPKEHVPYNTFSTMEITKMCFQGSEPPPELNRSAFKPPTERDDTTDILSPPGTSSTASSAPPPSTTTPPPPPSVFMACSLMYRGQVTPAEVTRAIKRVIKRRAVRFVSWTPTGFKVGINYQPVVTVPGLGLSNVARSVCQISNSTSAGADWDLVALKFDKMFNRKAFVFWYLGEGMEEAELVEARENVAALQKDYQEIREMIPPDRSREVPLLR